MQQLSFLTFVLLRSTTLFCLCFHRYPCLAYIFKPNHLNFLQFITMDIYFHTWVLERVLTTFFVVVLKTVIVPCFHQSSLKRIGFLFKNWVYQNCTNNLRFISSTCISSSPRGTHFYFVFNQFSYLFAWFILGDV